MYLHNTCILHQIMYPDSKKNIVWIMYLCDHTIIAKVVDHRCTLHYSRTIYYTRCYEF